MTTYTIRQIAAMVGKTERHIQNMAKKHHWRPDGKQFDWRGRPSLAYSLQSLPLDIQLAINLHETQKIKESQEYHAAALDVIPHKALATARKSDNLPLHKIEEALQKGALLRQYSDAIARADWGKKNDAKKQFLIAYNAGAWPEILSAIGPLTLPTLEKWRQQVKEANGDVMVLADTRGLWRIKSFGIPEINQQIFLACVLHPNKPKISEAIRMAEAIFAARGIPNGFHHTAYRRWIDHWIKTNYHAWVFNRQGAKAWNDNCAFYLERDITLINPGDIVVADGHILNFEIINPFTGKPKRMVLILWIDMRSNYPLGWEILPTENTLGIASAFRRACITLGKLPQVAYLDNGRAFGSRFFSGQDCTPVTGLFERAGVKTIHAWPYHGQSKTIERFFGTFAELERWAPSYTGTSIENKPPRLMRGETVHRALHNKVTGGSAVTLDQAHIAVAEWFEQYARRPQKGHLDGATPLEIFESGRGPGVDITSLNLMMLAEHIASPSRNGVYFLGRNYYHPDLANIRHQVLIRYDLQKRDSVLVYDSATGEFIAEATDMGKVHPAASILGTEADRSKLRTMLELKKRQEKQAASYCLRLLETEILPEHQKRIDSIIGQAEPLAPQSPTEPTDIKAIALSESDRERIMAQFEAERAHIEAELARQAEAARSAAASAAAQQAIQFPPGLAPDADLEPDYEVIPPALELRRRLEAMRPADRYEALLDMEVMGQMIPAEWQAYMTYFEMTPEYKAQATFFEGKRRLAAAMRQRSAQAESQGG